MQPVTIQNAVLRSSQDPERLSLTIKGLLVQLVPVMVLALQAFGISTIEADLVAIIESVTQLIAIGASAIGLLMTTWGMIRKVFNPDDFKELVE